jgi:metal-sulfur cluster biosynthetic enzyme
MHLRVPAPLRAIEPIVQAPYPYDGPEALREPVEAALRRVIDPELALTIVDLGLVYRVTVAESRMRVELTMTSAACPVADVILEDIESELDAVAPASMAVDVELVWEPAWSADRMSARAKQFMGW